ncbi:MAG: hypothetical protein JWQ42_1545, partial [Edaphobacter sp.]|nr:hypothetical protein [Edaphobacter sp.]
LTTEPYAPNVVRSAQSTPDGLHLAEPGATLEISDQEEEQEEECEEQEQED